MVAKQSCVLNTAQIAKILPHRYPFLLVDKIIEIDLENDFIIGQKNVTINEEFFQGHFPQAAIMPGVLLIEALAQTGGVLIHQKGFHETIAFLLSVNNAKFRRPVLPGDVLYLNAKGIHMSSKGGKIQAKAIVEDQIAAEAEIAFVLRKVDKI